MHDFKINDTVYLRTLELDNGNTLDRDKSNPFNTKGTISAVMGKLIKVEWENDTFNVYFPYNLMTEEYYNKEKDIEKPKQTQYTTRLNRKGRAIRYTIAYLQLLVDMRLLTKAQLETLKEGKDKQKVYLGRAVGIVKLYQNYCSSLSGYDIVHDMNEDELINLKDILTDKVVNNTEAYVCIEKVK